MRKIKATHTILNTLYGQNTFDHWCVCVWCACASTSFFRVFRREDILRVFVSKAAATTVRCTQITISLFNADQPKEDQQQQQRYRQQKTVLSHFTAF